jgi:hypothetical protein
LSKAAKWILGTLCLVFLIPLLVVKISDWHFLSNRNQASILIGYYPAAKCGDANFKALEIIDMWQDYNYLFEISGSRKCFESLKNSVVKIEPMPGDVIAKDADAMEDFGWYDIPQKDPGDELVGLKFESDGQTILWKRVQI